MSSLDRKLRKDLEKTVREARRTAEAGARQALERLAVHHREPWPDLPPDQRALRNRLRARGRQLGDARNPRDGAQEIERLVTECAYEHWHRMLFARFLAENELLVEPSSGQPISLADCQELAVAQRSDWVELASQFAVLMLPQIFRAGDPVLEIGLPPETRAALEQLLETLPAVVFEADDSLGWVYQFWQADQKEAIKRSEVKIGAQELPAVTQLFTEDYMVLFLLHNSFGAWWAGKVLSAQPGLAASAPDEPALRAACVVGGITWEYLRFVREGEDETGSWRPAAGAFEGWPKQAREITVLDPCMGSGHFLVFALPIMAALRRAEEGLNEATAVEAVLRDNLFGLEIDPRCTQIAAFNLALAAWKRVGHRPLPPLNLACSGIGINAREEDWTALAGDDPGNIMAMRRLYRLFADAPTLGSLIDPRQVSGELLIPGYEGIRELLSAALAREQKDEVQGELAVAAQGILHAAKLLAGNYTLVVTNVPYLGRGNQSETLRRHCSEVFSDAKDDLATCFVDRALQLCNLQASVAVVTSQNWLSQPRYRHLRSRFLNEAIWHYVVRLGPGAFETINGEVVTISLIVFSKGKPDGSQGLFCQDLSGEVGPPTKAAGLIRFPAFSVSQASQMENPDSGVTLDIRARREILGNSCRSWQGLVTSDDNRYYGLFWERPDLKNGHWEPVQQAPKKSTPFTGRDTVVRWENGLGDLHCQSKAHNFPPASTLGKKGVAIQRMVNLNVTLYSGEIFDDSVCPIIPERQESLTEIYEFCLSSQYKEAVRRINFQPKVIPGALIKVPFDLAHWQKVAAEKYPNGLPKPHSDDPTQWLFNGHPKGSDAPLQVAVARLLGYRWPRQTGSSFMDCPALGPDGLESHADDDGIVPLTAIKGETAAVERLAALLADAFGTEWSARKLDALLAEVGFKDRTLANWLRDGFFEQHCALFHQRPFIWQIWDGRPDGFSALVNYHRLAGPDGEGRRTLEKLIYSYLGDWIERQRAEQRAGVEGSDGRLAAAEHLRAELIKILEGAPPYDLFIRWKPLHQQPLGWEPDINDGVRLNIRPFMTAKLLVARGKNSSILRVTPKIKWDKDRGKEPARDKADFPWFFKWDQTAVDFAGGREFDGVRWNDLHYSRAAKEAARARAGQTGKGPTR